MSNQDVIERIRLYPQAGQLPCAVAHYIAAELNVAPLEVGQAANVLQTRITQCQLGLFGYAQKGTPAYKILRPVEQVAEDMLAAVQDTAADGRISCAALWQIGEQFGLSRHEMGNVAHALNLKVKPCQLGCF